VRRARCSGKLAATRAAFFRFSVQCVFPEPCSNFLLGSAKRMAAFGRFVALPLPLLAGSGPSVPDGAPTRSATAPDPKPPDASVRYEEARTYDIAPCPPRARRVRPALTEVGSS